MTLYEKDTSFSAGWMFGAAVLMTITNVFAGIVMTVLGVSSLAIIVGVTCACYIGCGFFVGLKSEGRTIIEAGLGAAIAVGASIAIQVARGRLELVPFVLVIACAPPFVCGILGAFIGEKVQGDTVEVQD
jgi:hypothetical protein